MSLKWVYPNYQSVKSLAVDSGSSRHVWSCLMCTGTTHGQCGEVTVAVPGGIRVALFKV